MGAAVVVALLCGAAWAAPRGEAAAAAGLYYKLVDVGRSFAAGVDYRQAAAFYREVGDEAAAFYRAYPDAAARSKLERVMSAYEDVYRLWGEAASAREDGEDALWHGSERYRVLDERYPGLFAALTANKMYGEYQGRRFYLLKAVAAQIDDGFAAGYLENLRQYLGLAKR